MLTSTKVQILTREAPKVSRERIEEILTSTKVQIILTSKKVQILTREARKVSRASRVSICTFIPLLASTKVQILTREAPKVSRERIEEILTSTKIQNLLTSTKVQILTREAPKVSRERIEEISPSINWEIFFEVRILLALLVQKCKC